MKKKPVRLDLAASTSRRRRAVQYVLVAAGLVFMIDVLVGDEGVMAIIKARREFQVLERALQDARSENIALREEARRLREDPDAIEDLARRDLGLIRPGEKLFIVKDVPVANPSR